MMTSAILIRLGAAAVCGAVLGLHVGLRERPGGLRTHIMTAMGAALFCLTGVTFGGPSDGALRALQGVASGVGFIGGSVVLKHGESVRGVATGASIWISAALGCAAGFGDYVTALGVAVFIALINVGSFYLEKRWLSKSPWSERAHEFDEPGDKS